MADEWEKLGETPNGHQLPPTLKQDSQPVNEPVNERHITNTVSNKFRFNRLKHSGYNNDYTTSILMTIKGQ